MPEITIPTRARVGYIEVDRKDKAGRTVKARQHVLPSHGLHSAKEMEAEMRRIADEVGAPHDAIRVEAYQRGEAPMEANPRHRGAAPRWERPAKPTRETSQRPVRVRRVFQGGIPQTESEWAAHIEAFYAARSQRR